VLQSRIQNPAFYGNSNQTLLPARETLSSQKIFSTRRHLSFIVHHVSFRRPATPHYFSV